MCPAHSGLRRLKDVIVFSTKGEIPLADVLSGGDYDGDQVWVCWDRQVVEPFRNNRSVKAFQTNFDHMEDIDPEVLSVRDLGPDPESPEFFREFFRRGFRNSLADDILGWCTDILTRYTYHNYPEVKCVDDTTIRLARLCSSLVDAPKQGLKPKAETRNMLRAINGNLGPMPAYRTPSQADKPNRVRAAEGPKEWYKSPDEWYILDRLVLHVGRQKVAEMRSAIHALEDAVEWTDEHLSRRCNEFEDQSQGDELLGLVRKKLHSDISKVKTKWLHKFNPQSQRSPASNFRADLEAVYSMYRDIKPAQEALAHPLVRQWHETADRPNSEWRLLKASLLFRERGLNKLPWWVAMPELCWMKAQESSDGLQRPTPRAVVEDMVFAPPNSACIRVC